MKTMKMQSVQRDDSRLYIQLPPKPMVLNKLIRREAVGT